MTAELLPRALSLHQAGRLSEAESLYQTILKTSPRHADALNLLGVIAHQRADYQNAVDLIGQAIASRGDQPSYYCNLAAAYCGLGRFDQAAACSETALSLDPNLIDAHLNLGLARKGAKLWNLAERAFQTVAERWPGDVRGFRSLGDCLLDQGRVAEAVAAYRNGLARHPSDGSLHLLLGTVLATNNDPYTAEPHLRRAVELMPNSVTALVHLGACLTQIGREQDAVPIYQTVLRLQPNNVKARVGIGQVMMAKGELAAAADWFNQALSFDGDHVPALCGLAETLRLCDQPDEAIPLCERAIRVDGKYQAYRILSDALSEAGETKRSEALVRESAERFPNQPEARIALGAALAAKGEQEGALAAYRSVLAIQPGHPLALARLALILGKRLPDDERAAAEAAIDQPAPIDQLASLHFGLAHVEDELGNFARAAEHLKHANALDKSHRENHGRQYSSQTSAKYSENVIAAFTLESLAHLSGSGNPSEQPVFVVGMPRSGTTLIEQILASHPRVVGVGEQKFAHRSLQRLPGVMGVDLDPLDCFSRATAPQIRTCADWHLERLRRIGGEADRIVDKMPENFVYLGWISVLFPKARIIHCRRDLRDVALSCWMTNFTSVRWSDDLHNLASRIKEYQRLMAHWENVLPSRILTIDYEKLVVEQESESRRMIEWLGLAWEPACLEFHRTQRTVRTASLTQVRQPIYSRSIGRWRHYRDVLRPLLDELSLELT
jgi:tetratricopeptide (TPR) repeat protein